MNQEKNSNKKKILTYYLILGACILVIAAITVTVIFAVKNANNNITLDPTDNNNTIVDNTPSDNTGNNDLNTPADDSANSGKDDTTVSTSYEFILPVGDVNVINDYTFYKNKTLDYYHFHTGLDFSAEQGAEVFACLDGTVESITTGDLLDGTVITIAHNNGLKTVYKFIDATENLKEGDTIKRGDVIGTIAEANGSEYKDGAHLHLEVYADGALSDPEDYLTISAK
jgi:murein DD-endopeptidase MepM/ murein hydrolase activator NlpD